MTGNAFSFTNKVRQATCLSSLTHNCVWTSWKMCKTRWQSYFAEPRKTGNLNPLMTTETPSINYKIGNERLISVTDNAARKLASLLKEKGQPEGALRLKVVGGGCSGLQYVMDLVDGPMERDILVPTQNVHLVVDPKSALFVSGSVLDYSEDLQKGGFKVTNPNAVAHCSCGESFAV